MQYVPVSRRCVRNESHIKPTTVKFRLINETARICINENRGCLRDQDNTQIEDHLRDNYKFYAHCCVPTQYRYCGNFDTYSNHPFAAENPHHAPFFAKVAHHNKQSLHLDRFIILHLRLNDVHTEVCSGITSHLTNDILQYTASIYRFTRRVFHSKRIISWH